MKDFIEKDRVNQVIINKDGIFNTPNTILESKLNLLFILMNTNKGQMVMNYDFGLNIESYLFDTYNADSASLKNDIINDIESVVADNISDNFKIKNIDAMIDGDYDSRADYIFFNIVWNIENKYLTESVSVFKLNDISNSFKTYFTTLQEYDPNEKMNKDYEMLTNEALIDAINLIKAELEEVLNKYNTSNIE
jgi:hypothetical protein